MLLLRMRQGKVISHRFTIVEDGTCGNCARRSRAPSR
jgi:hypothetical protein